MKKNEFFHRSVTIKSALFENLEVTRTRTSKGFSSITLVCPTGQEIVRLTVSNEGENADTVGSYERKAAEIGDLLRAIANDPCNLPKGWEPEESPDP